MIEYIERKALYEKAYWHGEHPDVGNPFPDGVDAIDIEDVDAIPAADVAPVRHGRWIEPSRLYYGAKQYECSLCCSDTFWKKHSITEKYPHCPNCGARMDGGDGNSDMA